MICINQFRCIADDPMAVPHSAISANLRTHRKPPARGANQTRPVIAGRRVSRHQSGRHPPSLVETKKRCRNPPGVMSWRDIDSQVAKPLVRATIPIHCTVVLTPVTSPSLFLVYFRSIITDGNPVLRR